MYEFYLNNKFFEISKNEYINLLLIDNIANKVSEEDFENYNYIEIYKFYLNQKGSYTEDYKFYLNEKTQN